MELAGGASELVAELWADSRFPLDEILDAPGRVFQALVGLRWHRNAVAQRNAERARHEQEMRSTHEWISTMNGLGGGR